MKTSPKVNSLPKTFAGLRACINPVATPEYRISLLSGILEGPVPPVNKVQFIVFMPSSRSGIFIAGKECRLARSLVFIFSVITFG